MTFISVLIATHGDDAWRDLAWSRAYPTAADQADEVLVVHEPDKTLAQTRNILAGAAFGDYLCFLDADDELEPGYIDRMREAFPRFETWIINPPDAPLLAPAVRYVDQNGSASKAVIPSKGRWPDLNECVIGTLVWRKLFAAVGGFRELPSLEDYDLWLRCVKAGATIRHVPAAVYRATVRAGSRNSDQSVYHRLRREHAEVWERGT